MSGVCKRAWRAGAAAALLLLAGCATYSDGIGKVERLLADGKTEAALKALDGDAGSQKDRVLYLLNKAMILHMAGDYRASNAALELAKPLIENNAVISVSEQASALTVNDSFRAYAGAPYERIYVHIYAALNYLALDQLDDARVEALQLDTALGQVDKKEPVPAGLAYYLSGLIFAARGEWDDAMIDYRKAYQAYRDYPADYRPPLPPVLKQDLLRTAARQGFADELARYREEFGMTEQQVDAEFAGKGEVIVVLQSGVAPLKRDTIASVYANDGRLVTIALPYYQARMPAVSQATLRATALPATAHSEPVEEVDRMAVAELDHEMPLIVARAVARAVIKNKAIKQTDRQGGDALGLVMNVAGIITERADTRSWSTLPGRIYIARLALAPGRYHLVLELRDGAGVVVGTKEYNDVAVKADGKRFISLRWVTAQDLIPRQSYLRPVKGQQR